MCGRLLLGFLRFDVIEVVGEEDVPHCPVQRGAVRRPRRELAADVGQLPDRHGGRSEVGQHDARRLGPHLCEIDDVDVPAELDEGTVALRREHDQPCRSGEAGLCGRIRIGRIRGLTPGEDAPRQVLPLIRVRVSEAAHALTAAHHHVALHVGAVPPERDQALHGAVRVDAVGVVGGEVGHVTESRGRDHLRLHGLRRPRRYPDELTADRAEEGPGGLLQVTGRAARGDDPLAVRRPRHVVVHRRRGREPGRRATPGRRLHDVAAVRVVPRRVADPLAVARPLRMKFADIGVGQALCLALGEVPDPETVERREDDLVTVRRDCRAPDLACRHHGGGVDLVVELDLGADAQLNLGLEGDLDGFAAVHGHVPDLAAVRDDDRRAVRQEAVAGQNVERRP